MSHEKVISLNRKAAHDYFLEDRYEAGLVLTGTEIKSIRQGRVNLKDSYVSFVDNEAFIKEMFFENACSFVIFIISILSLISLNNEVPFSV